MIGLSSAGAFAAAPVGPLLVAEPLASSPVIEELFGGIDRLVVPVDVLRVTSPWEGPLFALFDQIVASRAVGDDEAVGGGGVAPPPVAGAAAPPPTVGLVLPMIWTGSAPTPEVVLITDHVNLTLRGPLSGRRPPSGPPTFPSLSAIYQPALTRRLLAGRVYSEAAVAGVADAGRLTPFERRALAECACEGVCDCLVDAVIVAAYHGLHVAACGIPRAARQG